MPGAFSKTTLMFIVLFLEPYFQIDVSKLLSSTLACGKQVNPVGYSSGWSRRATLSEGGFCRKLSRLKSVLGALLLEQLLENHDAERSRESLSDRRNSGSFNTAGS